MSDAVLQALQQLVFLHDGPRDAFYETEKRKAWVRARFVLDANSCPECGAIGRNGCGAAWHDGKPDLPPPVNISRSRGSRAAALPKEQSQ